MEKDAASLPKSSPPPPPPASESSSSSSYSSSPVVNTSSEFQNFDANFISMYHSIFPPKSPPLQAASISFTPSTCSSFEDGLLCQSRISTRDDDAIATEDQLYQARLILECQELRDLCDLCLHRIRDLKTEADCLLRENAELRLANTELVKLLPAPSSSPNQSLFLSDFSRLRVGSDSSRRDLRRREESVSDASPTSVISNNQFERMNQERIPLPKSISVRSSGYLKLNRPGLRTGNLSSSTRSQFPRPLTPESQRVYVPAVHPGGGDCEIGKGEEEALEFDAYNQGMLKTELCNKWQETGACPYGEHCRFAHGIKELRPVLRHPRYKTEVCRIVLAGDTCPYGHRCHFRHSLNEQERLREQ